MGLSSNFYSASLAAKAPAVWICIFVVTIVAMGAAAYGQQASESTSVAADEALPAPVPLVDIATEAEAAAESIRDIRTDLSSDQSVAAVAQQLPAMTREIDGRLRESRRILAQRPSIKLLGSLVRRVAAIAPRILWIE
jgi:hypothetical protein